MQIHRFYDRKSDLELLGYSQAFEQSFFVLPRQHIALDGGFGNPLVFAQPHVFLTHLHMDHALHLPRYVVNRKKMGGGKGTLYVEERLVQKVEEIVKSWQKAEGRRDSYQIVGVQEGTPYPLVGNWFFVPLAVPHTLPALAFILYRKRSILKPEYANLSPGEISKKIQEKENPTETIEEPIFAYTGDMEIQGLDIHPILYKVRILVLECTFIHALHPTKKEWREKEGHISWEEIVERKEKFENEWIILTHFSQRYPPEQIFRHIQKTVPREILPRLRLWIPFR